ncbi:hypothetical protein ABZ260_17520 [Streptosporangium sp. NPDC006013]|uniref:hypothetical protein n=1 Tax=Streptosporangium sp. NPDC006013 TaxID=3155596 RepID=UPI0033A4197A
MTPLSPAADPAADRAAGRAADRMLAGLQEQVNRAGEIGRHAPVAMGRCGAAARPFER